MQFQLDGTFYIVLCLIACLVITFLFSWLLSVITNAIDPSGSFLITVANVIVWLIGVMFIWSIGISIGIKIFDKYSDVPFSVWIMSMKNTPGITYNQQPPRTTSSTTFNLSFK